MAAPGAQLGSCGRIGFACLTIQQSRQRRPSSHNRLGTRCPLARQAVPEGRVWAM